MECLKAELLLHCHLGELFPLVGALEFCTGFTSKR